MPIVEAVEGTPIGRRVFLGLAAFGVSGIVWGSKAAGLMERLLGPIAAMNGILLFGWSTAVIFEVLRNAMRIRDNGRTVNNTNAWLSGRDASS